MSETNEGLCAIGNALAADWSAKEDYANNNKVDYLAKEKAKAAGTTFNGHVASCTTCGDAIKKMKLKMQNPEPAPAPVKRRGKVSIEDYMAGRR